jgi:hypothetical protein
VRKKKIIRASLGNLISSGDPKTQKAFERVISTKLETEKDPKRIAMLNQFGSVPIQGLQAKVAEMKKNGMLPAHTPLKTNKMLLGGLLGAGIRYGVKRYAKASGKKLIDLNKGQSKKLAKSDKVDAIKLHGATKLSKLEKIKLNYYRDIL